MTREAPPFAKRSFRERWPELINSAEETAEAKVVEPIALPTSVNNR
jgi:hypothetical protein